ncbi:50S ribosomal protein L6 [Allocoprobacillus halotolerans]|uniref:Large ribosomal subunit protein uL6 n=1 Tax=Allocoprobacillus halotolerans TaxID=2944914 RepID=A0ABY5HXZ7_9FIRM|nr:50S ribosomal protein L6 [Allocoprobacillus halotolerans]UTY37947.1 50S ribosomal protein L6 [Allocoprobacillus halotolerans]
MSRVGNKIINVPEGVKVEIAADNTVTVTGAKGTLVRQFSPLININMDENVITVSRTSEQKNVKQLHGTTRALLANMIEGVHNGYKKELEVVGIGYRAQMQGNKLVLNVGYSHQVEVEGEEGVKIETPSQTSIVVSGISKERVGEIAARIRAVKKPEPYKGKGIKYVDERIIRKEGKTAGKK